MPGPILVTGGAGFIGSHVVDALLDAGHDVRTLDSLLAAAHREPPDYLDPRADAIEGDVRDPETADRAVDDVSAVCHQAAMVGLGTDIGDIADYVAHNDLGTAVLLKALAARRFTGPLVLASSMVVYGEGRYACREHGIVRPPPRRPHDLDAGRFEPPCPVCGAPLEPRAVPEDAPADPRNVYAATKVAQEHLCAAFARETGATVTALRYHNVYGPRMPRDTPYAGVASIFRSALAAGGVPRVFEDGGQLRDFVSIHDVVDCLVLMLEQPGADYQPVNVGSGQTITILEIARLLARLLGSPIEPQVTQTGRKFDIRHNTADITRAQQTLGFAPKVTLDEGFSELIEWAKTTPDVAVDFFDKALQELQDKGLLVKS
jgi:dTDP-L-rhamnose 4-epimerase